MSPTTRLVTSTDLYGVTSGVTDCIYVACPHCGWDSNGDLAIRDSYNDVMPPGPKGRADGWLYLDTDDPESGCPDTIECGGCDEEIGIAEIAHRQLPAGCSPGHSGVRCCEFGADR